MRTNRLLAALLVMLAAALPARAEDVVRVGNLKIAYYGPVSYMQVLAPKYGLKIEEHIFAKGIDIMPAIVAGEIDVGAGALDAAIAGRAGGARIYAVAGFARGGVRFVSRKDLGLKTIAALKGRKVGVTRGGAQELLLAAELGKHNLTWSDKPGKDVQLVYLPYADLNQALMGKQIDAMAQAEPQASQALNKGIGAEMLKPYDTPLGEPARALVMTEKLYSEKPDVALRLLKCFVEATMLFRDKPDLALKYVRDEMFKGQITDQDFKDAMNNATLSLDLPLDHVQVTTDIMVKYGIGRMAKPPVATDWVKLDLLNQAKAAQGVQ